MMSRSTTLPTILLCNSSLLPWKCVPPLWTSCWLRLDQRNMKFPQSNSGFPFRPCCCFLVMSKESKGGERFNARGSSLEVVGKVFLQWFMGYVVSLILKNDVHTFTFAFLPFSNVYIFKFFLRIKCFMVPFHLVAGRLKTLFKRIFWNDNGGEKETGNLLPEPEPSKSGQKWSLVHSVWLYSESVCWP